MFTLFSSDGICGTGKQVFPSLRHVLVVEDNVAIADMLCQTLELAGYRATAYVGAEAWIDSAMQSDDPPALVLLGLDNPETNGAAFLHHLRVEWKTAPPIIVLTTSKEIHDEVAGERVVQKPFHVRDLLAEIHNVLP